jgi:hypothetical protein
MKPLVGACPDLSMRYFGCRATYLAGPSQKSKNALEWHETGRSDWGFRADACTKLPGREQKSKIASN